MRGGAQAVEGAGRGVRRERQSAQLGVDQGAAQGAFEFAHVAAHAVREKVGHVGRQLGAFAGGDGLQNRPPQIEVRRLQVGDQAGLEAAAEAREQARDLGRRLVAAEHDLAALGVQRIERVEDLFLRGLRSRQELHVVDEQDVDRAVALAEAARAGAAILGADRVQQIVGEGLAGDVEHAGVGIASDDGVADGMQEMGLAQADAAVDEQRVIGVSRRLADAQGGGVGEPVGGPDDEALEGEPRVQPDRRASAPTPWARGRPGRGP